MDRENTSLIIVDMQNDFIYENGFARKCFQESGFTTGMSTNQWLAA
jgi:nicotinamidase-related amidase